MAADREPRVPRDRLGPRRALVRMANPRISLQVTRVDAMDMRGETPVRRLPLCDLFLVDSRSHCWTVTRDPQAATAVVLADKA